MKCAIYCRLSKEDGAFSRGVESESIQNQKTLLCEYANAQGWQVYSIYTDEDYSGADRTRPAFNEMLIEAKSGRFQLILCKTQSRFTRDMEMVEKYIHGLFPIWGIRFVALADNADTDIKGNKKARQISGLINEWYLEDLSENIRIILDSKRKNGMYIGSHALYGYMKDPLNHNKLIIDSKAAKVVREIFSLYRRGYGKQKIASILSERKIPSPSQYRKNPASTEAIWNKVTVGRILSNEMYTGTMVQGLRRKSSYKSPHLLSVPKDQWIRVPNTHEAIIDRATFEAVGDIIESKKHKV